MSTAAPPACDGLRVTAYVDDGLPPPVRAEVEAHLAGCPACRDQEAFERGLRETLRALPVPEMSSGFEDRLRRRLRKRPVPAAVRWLPLAAVLVLAVLWGRGSAPFVAWELARDHAHCFGRERLNAELWTSDPRLAAAWYRENGVELPWVPGSVTGLELVGGRRCPLPDRQVAHLFYAGEKRRLSVFVVPGPARFSRTFAARIRGQNVRLLRSSGLTVGLVSEEPEVVEAMARALSVSRAGPAPRPRPEGLLPAGLVLLPGLPLPEPAGSRLTPFGGL